MRLALLICLSVAMPLVAHADCAHGVALAYRRAGTLPPSKGKAALLEQIQRADIAHHEDDESGCNDALAIATNVLNRIDAARRIRPPR